MSEAIDQKSSVFVAGHKGLVGSAVVRKLYEQGYKNVLTADRSALDLRQEAAVAKFLGENRPDVVIMAAATVGGIHANSHRPAEFIRDNLAMQTNLTHSAWQSGVKKLVFLGSSCIYPRDCPQPMRESALLSGPLEPTNRWYAIAKISGLMMCQAYREQYGFDAISLMPTNLYGPGDNFHANTSHVIPGLIGRFHDARINGQSEVVVWGSGLPLREFLHADDLADAIVMLMETYSASEPINIGSGEECSISALARLIADVVGYQGKIRFDTSRPDGPAKKLLDSSRIRQLGWMPKLALEAGLKSTYRWYCSMVDQKRVRL